MPQSHEWDLAPFDPHHLSSTLEGLPQLVCKAGISWPGVIFGEEKGGVFSWVALAWKLLPDAGGNLVLQNKGIRKYRMHTAGEHCWLQEIFRVNGKTSR